MAVDEAYPDPLQYLNRVERFLVGWIVVRAFARNSPRFAKWVQSSGPHAAARSACAQAFVLYIWGFGIPAVILNTAGLFVISDLLLLLAGACLIASIACVISGFKPQREYRRTQMKNGG
jgi:hypothetical protein